ncbi:MAG: glycosyltransferase [Deltaproteobacteria bacterium]|nr:glycosyltransferase [Deltaproteobacteria bacterium]
MKHFLSFYLGGQKVFVLPNPIIVRQYDHPEDIPRQRLLVTYLGAILPEKGVFDLVKAFQRVIKRQPTAKLSIFGNKQLDLLRTIIQEASLQNHIEVNAWLSKRDLIKQIKTTGLLVLPSYSEGIPSILLEAMASKTPILTTKVGGIPEILTEASATFSDPGDIEDLAGKILFCLDHPNLLAQKAAIAYDSVLQYDLKTIAAKWLCIILEVYDNEHSSR